MSFLIRIKNGLVNFLDVVAYYVFSRMIFLGVVIIIFLLAAWYSIVRTITCDPNCIGFNLTNRDFRGIDLSEDILMEANFQDADLSGGNLRGADLSGAILIGTNLQNADLSRAKLLSANLTGADLRNAILDNTDLRGANLTRADLTRTDLTTTQLDGAIFEQAKLVEANLQDKGLGGVVFRRANMTGARLDRADLSGNQVSGANLSDCSLVEARLSGAIFNLGNMTGADLTDSVLAGSYFIGADLTSVDFTRSNLVGATMIGARLNGANLSAANLNGVRLFLAELEDGDLDFDPVLAELNELQLEQTVTNVDLSGIQFTQQTQWPAGKLILLADMLGLSSGAGLAAEPETTEVTEPDDSGVISLPPIDPNTVTGDIAIAGSSTIFPLSDAIGLMFVSGGYSGNLTIESLSTGAGFEMFCQEGSIDIVNASRPITEEEMAACAELDREPVPFRVGTDALAIVINPTNHFISEASLDDLAALFTVGRWADVDPHWPSDPILRFVPDPDTGTFDFFVERVLANNPQPIMEALNTEFNTREADIIWGVASNADAIGFVGYTYYQQNTETMKLLTVEGVEPTAQAVANDEYILARPLFMYSDAKIIQEKPQVGEFISFYLSRVNAVAERVGYFPNDPVTLDEAETTLMDLMNLNIRRQTTP